MSSLEADPIHRVPRLLRFRDAQANDLALCIDGTAATLQQLGRALSVAALAVAEGDDTFDAAAVLAEHGKLLQAISQTIARRSETTRREWSLKEQEERS
jgi:hypothetical protein